MSDETTQEIPQANQEQQETTSAPAPMPESIIPEGNVAADVPADVAAELPIGTQVSTNADGQLVASVPHEGTVHHIVGEAVAEFAHLIDVVRHYFETL